ncbi:uncharacterized protein LOC141617170 [Silene latifolia]|uniref:uncharacterized protein LOC141617170 n=1 Tax=Silene latifolia TaxID=37657 RepID=UPI003D7864BC
MLAKHAWRILSGDQSLFSRVFRKKLLVNDTVHEGLPRRKKESNLSWGARSIMHGMDFTCEQVSWKPGYLSQLNVLTNKWMDGNVPDPRDVFLSRDSVRLRNFRVGNLRFRERDMEGRKWNEGLIREIFSEDSVKKILSITICKSSSRDEVYWIHSPTCDFTVKSAYGVLFSHFMAEKGSQRDRTRIDKEERNFCRKKLWCLPGPMTWKMLLWTIITKSLSVGSGFVQRNINIDPTLLQIHAIKTDDKKMETMEHMFRDCEVAKRIWASTELGIRVLNEENLSLSKWIMNWIRYLDQLDDAKPRVFCKEGGSQAEKNFDDDGSEGEQMRWIRESKPVFVIESSGSSLFRGLLIRLPMALPVRP